MQLAAILRGLIAEGAFRPGDQLPSEAQLCRAYGISPMTVRRTINLLADEGVVSTVQGRGTFVRPLELGTALFDLHELQALFGAGDTAVTLLETRVVSTDGRTARKLGLEPGEKAIYMRRLLTLEGQPVAYHRAYLVYDPKRPIVEAELDVTSLQGLLTHGRSQMVKRGELSMEATMLNEEEARILQAGRPAAAFYLEHIFYDFEERPISWGWFIFTSDRLRFTTQIGLQEGRRDG